MTVKQEINHAFARSLSNAGLEVTAKQNKFCIACLGAGGAWYARFTGLCLPEWKKCRVCTTDNVQIEGQPASGLSRSNAGLGTDNGDENDKSTR